MTALLQERYEQAHKVLLGSLEIAFEAGDAAGMAMDLDRLGQAAIALGQPERAVTLAGAASRLREHAGGGTPSSTTGGRQNIRALPRAVRTRRPRSTWRGLGAVP